MEGGLGVSLAGFAGVGAVFQSSFDHLLHHFEEVQGNFFSFKVLQGVADGKGRVFCDFFNFESVFEEVEDSFMVAQVEG